MQIARIDDEITADDFVKTLKLDNRFNTLIEQILIDKLTVRAAKQQGHYRDQPKFRAGRSIPPGGRTAPGAGYPCVPGSAGGHPGRIRKPHDRDLYRERCGHK